MFSTDSLSRVLSQVPVSHDISLYFHVSVPLCLYVLILVGGENDVSVLYLPVFCYIFIECISEFMTLSVSLAC